MTIDVLTVTPTDRFLDMDGATVRVWEGRTRRNTRCLLMVRGLLLPGDDVAGMADLAGLDAILPPRVGDATPPTPAEMVRAFRYTADRLEREFSP